MPSTARVVISQRSTLQTITESLDDVWNTQYGRHMSMPLAAGADASVSWPATGEKYCYIAVVASGATPGTVSVKPTGAASAWVTDLPIGGLKTPFLLPKPNTVVGFVLNASVAAEANMVFF
jgi:hypothetical protein